MDLTVEEQQMLEGEKGETLAKAMEILLALGKIYEAQEMVEVKSAQVSGVSYKNLGEAGVEFLEEFCGEKVKVSTTLNPAGMDLERWKEMGISREFAQKQLHLMEIFKKLGISPTYSCTPYLIGNLPEFGDHIAWAESSAVSYANSVLGARTNRESGISALCCALTGRTPLYGYHLEENRRANFLIEVECDLNKDSDFGALGYLVGKEVQGGVPYFTGIEADQENLKFLGAAMAASGAVALYHAEGITPEARKKDMLADDFERITIESIKEGYENLNSGREQVDLVALGCPHTSPKELKKIEKLLRGKKVQSKLWIMTSRKTKEKAENLVKKIEKTGAKVFADTCMVVSPLEELGFETVAVNSGKAAFYLPSYCGVKVKFGSLEKCVRAAVNGKWN